MLKFHHGQVPDSISSIFQLNSDVHSYSTRRKFALRSFRGNHKFIYNTFSFQAVYIWNEISRCVITNVSFRKFKKISKAYIQSHQLLMGLNIWVFFTPYILYYCIAYLFLHYSSIVRIM